MKCVTFILFYGCFFGLIGASVWFTKSAWPLIALIITPSATINKSP